MLILDNSIRSVAQTCLRKYYYQHIRNLESEVGSTALRYGLGFHAGAEELYKQVKAKGYTSEVVQEVIPTCLAAIEKAWDEYSEGKVFYEDYRSLVNLQYAFTQYISTFLNDANYLQVLETERKFNIQISDKVIFAGKIDAEVLLSGNKWNIEYKTTSTDLTTQAERLHRSPQMMGYFYAARELGNEVAGTLVVFHKIKAGKLKSGDYGKLAIDFKRVPQIYTDTDISLWKESFLHTADLIIKANETGKYPMALDNCYQFGKCGCLNLCLQGVPLGEESTYGYQVRETPWTKEIMVEA